MVPKKNNNNNIGLVSKPIFFSKEECWLQKERWSFEVPKITPIIIILFSVSTNTSADSAGQASSALLSQKKELILTTWIERMQINY